MTLHNKSFDILFNYSVLAGQMDITRNVPKVSAI